MYRLQRVGSHNTRKIDVPMLVSLHIPKTAGTTLDHSFEQAFGGRVMHYNCDPERLHSSTREEIKNKFDVVHGHLDAAALKLLVNEHTVVITFLRDPVQRVISSYFFHKNPAIQNPIAEKVRSESMTLEEFSDMPCQKNLQTAMAGLIGRDRFDFIGITEKFSKSIKKLSTLLSQDLELRTPENVNAKKNIGDIYTVSPETHDFIKTRNMEDIKLYQNVWDNFEN